MEQEENEELNKVLKLFETRLDAQEEMIATLVMAYAEAWVSIETIVNDLLGTRSEEDREKFMKDFSEFRRNMLQSLKEAGKFEVASVSPDLAAAVENLITGEPASPSE